MATDIIFRVEGPIYHEVLSQHFTIHNAFASLDDLPEHIRATVPAVVTNGTVGLTAAEMDRLPALRLISTVGTGYEAVDVAAALSRGIGVTHAAGVNAGAVAEYAIGMLIASVRNLWRFDEAVRSGSWRGDVPMPPLMGGKRLGIFGMGGVGTRLGKLAEAFGMTVAYASRTAKPELPWTFHPTLLDLAQNVDFLIIAAPGGPATRHAVDDTVIDALGPKGHLVNVGRGSIIETAVLTRALASGRLGGAALDVFEEEPEVPADLRALPNVILAPHIAGLAQDVQRISAGFLTRNITAMLEGQPLVTPVPEMK